MNFFVFETNSVFIAFRAKMSFYEARLGFKDTFFFHFIAF